MLEIIQAQFNSGLDVLIDNLGAIISILGGAIIIGRIIAKRTKTDKDDIFVDGMEDVQEDLIEGKNQLELFKHELND